jgi:hypothetical protein
VNDDGLMDYVKMHERGGFGGVCLDNYFEDEDGNYLDEVDFMAILSGQSRPIILGNVSSVLRLTPSEMLNAAKWTVENSDDFVHFIQVVGILQRSRWWRDSPRLSEAVRTRLRIPIWKAQPLHLRLFGNSSCVVTTFFGKPPRFISSTPMMN